MRYSAILLILMVLIPAVAFAIPSGTTVSLVSNNNATFSASGFSGDGWFEYGMSPDTLNVWTSNITGGTWTEIGSPLTSGETYYVAGCDSTGCDSSPVSFTMGTADPLPTTTFGYMITNATQNKFNTLMFMTNLPQPYAWLFPASATALALSIITALVLFAIYYGYAVRTRGIALVTVLAILTSGYLMYADQGMNLGIPVEFRAIAQGIFYASIAGLLLILLRK
jgi:hypothetical protein